MFAESFCRNLYETIERYRKSLKKRQSGEYSLFRMYNIILLIALTRILMSFSILHMFCSCTHQCMPIFFMKSICNKILVDVDLFL
jgi:hypothetical protein